MSPRTAKHPSQPNFMTSLRLFFCCYLCAFTYNVWAARPQAGENIEADPNAAGLAMHKQEKFAGRANYFGGANGAATKNPNARYPLYTQEAHERKPMSKEEKQALRRQINETETLYPKKN